jgi:hypothetical protein
VQIGLQQQMSEQTADLFGFKASQGDLFVNEPARNPGTVSVDPNSVRIRLHKLLSEARAAEAASPWNERKTRLYQQVFPQMANWLPNDEAEQLRFEFESELRRLRIAA